MDWLHCKSITSQKAEGKKNITTKRRIGRRVATPKDVKWKAIFALLAVAVTNQLKMDWLLFYSLN